ncbi:CYTH and CHAD domain-containing protein [Pelistega suis]|uniref:CYTH and CHAD domain-containing protein n=1 Tax=Pelistega suis TaxID=1631957 RepID=UPI00211CF79D|nr:CYTH and CHAD domain-containing protein [Pelistega suis]MCQ9329775.1 CYTH and CHAD domain-containing protein [Pelistega suis]
MSEQELKLHVPRKSRQKISSALANAESITLRAMYFDTADRQLAKAKAAIRLRQEGEDWIQTLKMAGANSLSRLELNHHRPGPILDLSLYAGTAAEPLLTKLSKPLELRYETDIVRLLKKQRTRKGTVEIAYDTGVVRAGHLELPIHEVEFELVSGNVEAIFDLGMRWLNDYQLILDVRSKAHRGDALANIITKINSADEAHKETVELQEITRLWNERKAQAYSLDKNLSATQALCRLTEECIEQISLNAAYLAEVDTDGISTIAKAEHVHQLRVGMRRLVSNWKLFAKNAHLPEDTLQAKLKQFLAEFGATRDTDVMLATILPHLQKAGMPVITVDHYQGKSATEIARLPEFQTFLVQLLAWTTTAPSQDPIDAKDEDDTAINDDAIDITASTTLVDGLNIIPLIPSVAPHNLRKTLEKRLNNWNKSIVRHWRYNDKNDIEAYHDVRKKIKRMRYGLNVYEALEPQANLNNYIKRLAKAQETFGELNDYASALEYFSKLTPTHPEAWFAVGWLSAQLKRLKQDADTTLKALPHKIDF